MPIDKTSTYASAIKQAASACYSPHIPPAWSAIWHIERLLQGLSGKKKKKKVLTRRRKTHLWHLEVIKLIVLATKRWKRESISLLVFDAVLFGNGNGFSAVALQNRREETQEAPSFLDAKYSKCENCNQR